MITLMFIITASLIPLNMGESMDKSNTTTEPNVSTTESNNTITEPQKVLINETSISNGYSTGKPEINLPKKVIS